MFGLSSFTYAQDEAKPMATKTDGWVKIESNSNILPNKLFSNHKLSFGLNDFSKMVKYREKSDELGFTHHWYQQTFNGVKVEGCEYIVHEKNERTISANGKIVSGLALSTTPSISRETRNVF